MVASANLMKLVAAGCVVGLLSGIPVRAEADAMAPGDAGEEYEEPMMDEEVPVEEEEAPEDAFESPAEAPEEEEVPEDEAMAPEAEEMDEDTAADVDPDSLKAMGYSATQGVDYVPGPGKSVMAADVTSTVVATAEECAAACDAEPACNIAAYFTADFPNDMNCWMKGIKPGCTTPADTDPTENAWLLVSDTKCDVEVAAPAPMAATAPAAAVAAGMYTRYEGSDYIPSSVTGMAPNLVTIADIGTGANAGLLVDDIAACEAACDAEPTCNTASFYLEVIAETGKNCYLKVLGDSCALPSDALPDPNAILSLKCADAAGPTVDAAPPAAVLPPAPFAPPPASEPTTQTPTTRETSGVPTDGAAVTDGTPSAAASVYTSVAAVAVAGAVALL